MKMYTGISVSRVYLDSLSSADLVSLADEYDIDIPEGLNRRFIIGELLEAIDESNNLPSESENLENGEYPREEEPLQPSYNETRITVLLRNPAWAYVYWDIKESDLQELTSKRLFHSFVLRVSFFSDEFTEKIHDYYDIPVEMEDRERYVFLCHAESSFCIDLVAEFQNLKSQVLAQSRRIRIPKGAVDINQVVSEETYPPLLSLSDIAELKREHFINYRQSFS